MWIATNVADKLIFIIIDGFNRMINYMLKCFQIYIYYGITFIKDNNKILRNCYIELIFWLEIHKEIKQKW